MYLGKFCKASYEYKKCNGKHISVGTFKKKEEPENDDTADIIVTNVNHAQNSALIQTAIASILFDTGSQKFYFDRITGKVFGKSEWKLQKGDIVALKVFTRNNETNAIQHQVRHALENYKHLRNLKLVHTTPHESQGSRSLLRFDNLRNDQRKNKQAYCN